MTQDESLVRRVEVVNRAGLHARPCHAIVSAALRYHAELRVRAGDSPRCVNGKSILELMTLEAAQGVQLEFAAAGDDANSLLDELEALVRAGFSEPK